MKKTKFSLLLILLILLAGANTLAVENVGSLDATAKSWSRIDLSWTTVNCTMVIIRASTTHYPANPLTDGQVVGMEQNNVTSKIYYTPYSDTTYYFTVFSMDENFQYSTGVTASARTMFNNPPSTPNAIYPADNMTGIIEQPVTFNVSFHTTDNIDHDSIQVDIYFAKEGEPLEMVTMNMWTWAGDITTYNVGPIESASTYNWRVVAKTGTAEVSSPIWRFSTSYAGLVDNFEDGNVSDGPLWWTYDGVSVATVNSTAEGSFGMRVSGTADGWYIGGTGVTYTQDVSDLKYISLFVKNDTEWASNMGIGLKETDGDEWAYAADVTWSDWIEINIPISAFTYNGGSGDGVFDLSAESDSIKQFTLNLNATTVNHEIISYSVDKVRFMQSSSLIESAPQIIARSPSGNSYNAPLITSIKAVFSEAMNKASVESAFSIIPTKSGVLNWSGNTVVFSPSSSLNRNTTYNISFSGAKDLNGDLLAGNTGWLFNTGGGLDDDYRPEVLSWSPTGIDIPLEPTILITFSDAMNKNSVENGIYLNGSLASTLGTLQWFGNSLAIVPNAPLPPNTIYTVSVNASVTDADNDSLNEDFTYSFKTGNGIGGSIPYVMAHSPAGSSVELNPTVSVLFSEAMNATSVQNGFEMTGNPAGVFSWSGNLLNFKTTLDLILDSRYTVTVNSGVLDSEGDSLTVDKIWRFIISLPDLTPPSRVIGLSITSNGSIHLSWNASTDNVSIPSAIKYEIIYSQQPTFNWV
ncbi:MAG: Ig-like domain-containing protein, partial [Candidatus Margulisiibacteriota bacterium]